MTIKTLLRQGATGLIVLAGLAGAASAASLKIEVTNNQADNGVYLTPLLTLLHDGSFDSFDTGNAASASLEALAEEGNAGLVAADAQAAGATTGVIFGPEGFAGAPVLDPGESASIRLDVDRFTERYFSFLSMVIPSNDIFIGNDNPMAYQLFDAEGNFTGLGPIQVYATDAWDAGTELNDGQGAPFSTAGGSSTDLDAVIARAPDGLFFLNDQNTVAGSTISLPNGRNLLATIEVSQVPLPAGAPLLLAGLGAFGWLGRRRLI